MRGFLYLATPYTRYREGLDAAFHSACRAAGLLIKQGIPCFSPIAHSHPIASVCGLDAKDHEIWLPADRPMMEAASALLVVKLDGWADSFGIAEEIKAFRAMHKPVLFITIEDLDSRDICGWIKARIERASFPAPNGDAAA